MHENYCYYFLSLVTCAYAISDEANALQLLKRDLRESIEVKSTTEIQYCPDNTCEMFKTVKVNSDFPAFIYLYLYHQSHYIYLNKSVSGIKAFRLTAIEEPVIRHNLSHYCSDEKKSPDCILQNMQQELGIIIGAGRFDEGYFCYGYTQTENICHKL